MKPRFPPILRLPLAAFALAAVLGGAAYFTAAQLHRASTLDRQQAELAGEAVRAALDQLPGRIAMVQSSGNLHADLERRGFIGSERRLDWISSLSRLRAELGLSHLSWRIEPRINSAAMPGLVTSRMHLGLAPMDPERLRVFLDRLARESHGVFTTEHCDWLLDDPQGRMQCELIWWTWSGQGRAP